MPTSSRVPKEDGYPSRRSPWTQALYDILRDGSWKDHDGVLESAGRKVPPARAFHKGEWARRQHYIKRGIEPGPRTRGTNEDSIRTGARMLVINAIRQLRREGRVEVVNTPDGKRWIRDVRRARALGKEKDPPGAEPPRLSKTRRSEVLADQNATPRRPRVTIPHELEDLVPEYGLTFGKNVALNRWELRDGVTVIFVFESLGADEIAFWQTFATNRNRTKERRNADLYAGVRPAG